jgi:hypothetical protein
MGSVSKQRLMNAIWGKVEETTEGLETLIDLLMFACTPEQLQDVLDEMSKDDANDDQS